MYENRLNTTEFCTHIAALDLGTSKILAIIGKKNNKKISTVITEQIPSDGCIRRGCIYNTEHTALLIQSLIDRLNQKLTSNIWKVYVGIGGQSLRLKTFSIKKEINGLVTESTIQQIEKEYQALLFQNQEEILKINSPEYYLDGKKEKNPQNYFCKLVEVKCQVLFGRPSLKHLIQKSLEKSRVKVVDFIISPVATAEATLSITEKENGCALVEIGAGVTYLSIYKYKKLQYLVTIPLGGSLITTDISTGLNVTESEAESLKINDRNHIINFDKQKEQLLDIIIEERMNEIVTNIVELIKKSGYISYINEGIILTGGGSLLKNINRFFTQKINQKKIHISTVPNATEACALGIAMIGNENCIQQTGVEKIKISNKQKELSKNLSKPIHKILSKLTRSIFDYEE